MPSNNATDRPTVAVLGATSLDITIREAPDWMGRTGRDAYTPDSLHTLASPVEMGLGGNGGAAAYALGKLGSPVELFTSIGADAPGQLVRGWLQEAGVRCVEASLEKKSAASTMVAFSAVDQVGQRMGCLQHPGAPLDWTLSASDTHATWLLAMVHSLVGADELPAVHRTLQQFREAGRITAVDTGMGWIIHPAQPAKIHALWEQASLVTGTLDELAHWTGKQDPAAVAQAVLDCGAAQVVIKMGPDGAACQSAAEPFANHEAIRVRQANRSIGAGDAFAGAVVASLSGGQSLSTAVTGAGRIAAQVVAAGRGVLAVSTWSLEST